MEDAPSGPSGRETLPYGVQMVQAAGPPLGGASLLHSGVSLCVLDTGISTSHPDLRANAFTGCRGSCHPDRVPYDAPRRVLPS